MGIFHIKCLEDILTFSSPTILPHIIPGANSNENHQLDLGAAAIVRAWYEKCEMDNMVTTAINATTKTVSDVVATTDEDISSTKHITAVWSSTSAPAPSADYPLQWQRNNLVWLPDLNKIEFADVKSHSWHHDRESLIVPWAEDIVTDKLPRLPSNGGFALESDVQNYLKDQPWERPDGKLWSLLSYLPHDPSQWCAKHALSETLGRWCEARVRGQILDF